MRNVFANGAGGAGSEFTAGAPETILSLRWTAVYAHVFLRQGFLGCVLCGPPAFSAISPALTAEDAQPSINDSYQTDKNI